MGESFKEKLARGHLLLQGHIYACRCPHVGDIKTHGLLNCAIFTASNSRVQATPQTGHIHIPASEAFCTFLQNTHMKLSTYVNSMESCSTTRTFGRCFGLQQKLRVFVEIPQCSIWTLIKKIVFSLYLRRTEVLLIHNTLNLYLILSVLQLIINKWCQLKMFQHRLVCRNE